jgi:hypothetical protein
VHGSYDTVAPDSNLGVELVDLGGVIRREGAADAFGSFQFGNRSGVPTLGLA